MATDTNGMKERLAKLNENFSTGQKVAMVAAVVGVVAALFLFTKATASTPKQAALYTGLQSADAAAVTEKLTAGGVSYTLADGGATVMVPADQLYDLRLQMAAEGLPTSGSEGYALLDKQGLTTSEFAQQVGYQRALEGELEKTLGAMAGVQATSVHLAIPKNDVFATDTEKASASVMVTPKAGEELDPTQVQAIVHLVASSVQGLDPADVTVTDATGTVLVAPGVDTSSAGMDMNTRQRTAYEQQLADSITALIDPVVGAGKAHVTVNAQMNFDKSTATSETYTQPSGDAAVGTPQNQTTRTETYTAPSAAATGVLGTTGTAGGTGTNTDYSLVTDQTQNALNRTVETVEAAPGTVTKLSVALAIDSAAASPETVQKINDLVTAGAGIDTARGDTLSVTRVEFDTAAADQRAKDAAAADALESRDQMLGYAKQGGVALILGLVLFVIWRNLRRVAARRAALSPSVLDIREVEARVVEKPRPLEVTEWSEVTDMDEIADVEQVDELPAPTPALPQPIPSEEVVREQLSAEVAHMIDRQPAEVAQVLRTWLGDRTPAKR